MNTKFSTLALFVFILWQQLGVIPTANARSIIPTTHKPVGVVFFGGDIASRTAYGYIGAIRMLNGHGLGESGPVLKGTLGYGQYKYDDVDNLGQVKGKITDIAIQLGYSFVCQGHSMSFFVGPHYQRNVLSPSEAESESKGRKVGAQFGFEAHSNPQAPVAVQYIHTISTANAAYWSRFRVGWRAFRSVHLGPEVTFLGSQSFQDRRYGAFASVNVSRWNISVGAGYSDKKGSDSANNIRGAYGGLSLSSPF